MQNLHKVHEYENIQIQNRNPNLDGGGVYIYHAQKGRSMEE